MSKVQHDAVKWRCNWHLDKFWNADDTPYETIDGEGNLLVNAGINALCVLLAGGGGNAFNNANSYIGVGDSTTAAAAAQTDLQAATNKLRVAMDSTYPTSGTAQQIVFKSTFGTSQANFAWDEFGTFNASTAGTMLNRKVTAFGTKTSAESWALTVSITIS